MSIEEEPLETELLDKYDSFIIDLQSLVDNGRVSSRALHKGLKYPLKP
jgi:hypothetical protein